jgi:hypothetical protein
MLLSSLFVTPAAESHGLCPWGSTCTSYSQVSTGFPAPIIAIAILGDFWLEGSQMSETMYRYLVLLFPCQPRQILIYYLISEEHGWFLLAYMEVNNEASHYLLR